DPPVCRIADYQKFLYQLKRIPYLLIVGEKEEAEGLVSVRAQGEGDKGQMSREEFKEFIQNIVSQEIEANKMRN
ncbi:MAG: hypothetical protein J6R73_00320, partial [Alistipes sp.]|nr:hypothetical protein [Alistipes sp.]